MGPHSRTAVVYTCMSFQYPLHVFIYYVAMAGLYIAYTPHQYST